MSVLVVAPREKAGEVGGLPEGVLVVAYADLQEALAALRTGVEPAVLWSDGLLAEWLELVAVVVRGRRGPVIEVRSERWDGETHSPLSAACRGVVSGFGAAGVRAAVGVPGR